MQNEQQVQYHLQLLQGGSVPLQDKHREEQVGLPGTDLLGKPPAFLQPQSLDTQHRVDEIATRDRCHATTVRRGGVPRPGAYLPQNASTAFIRRRFSVVT